MKTGLYFGSFNPVHTGHLIIADFAANHTDLNQVWLVVSPQNPFKPAAGLLNEYQRLELVKLAIEGNNKLKASDIEFKLPKPSYTIDTLTYLEEKYPKKKFVILMGSDGFSNLNKWKNIDILIDKYEFYIYPRPGFEIKNTLDAKIKPLNTPLLDISATQIRNNIKNGKSIKYLVPDSVAEEIERTGYYKK
jgi:nicotinate-nucleotide adenylyltransferase